MLGHGFYGVAVGEGGKHDRGVQVAGGDSGAGSRGTATASASDRASATASATPIRPSIARASEPAPGSSIGHFLLRRKLGEGGMGMVFEAEDPTLQRVVALKLLRPSAGGSVAPESQHRMLREAQAMAMLQHPNLVTIYEVGTHGNDVFIAMEYVVGCTLQEWLEQGPHLEDKLEVFEQAAAGLQAVHDAGLVHRDFKPENVMVTDDGVAKVLDLGIARKVRQEVVEELTEEVERKRAEALEAVVSVASFVDSSGVSALDTPLTQEGALLGTPQYMAAEQLLGENAGPAADQFAFAVALYEALTGERPFAGEGAVATMANVVTGERAPWPDDCEAPPRMREAIDRALSNDPSKRFDSITECFQACLDGVGLRGQIRYLTSRWLEHQKHRDYLLHGQLLREGSELLRDQPGALSGVQVELVRASQQHAKRRRLLRSGLVIGVALLLLALVPSLWLAERRSDQLAAETRARVHAELREVSSRVEALFRRDLERILLMYEQRGAWLPLAEQLFVPHDDDSERNDRLLRAGVRRLNAFFAPVISRTDTISSLMVARDDDAEYLAFEDTEAEGLTPPYRFYNRLVHTPRFGQSAFQLFFPVSGEGPPRSDWMALGDPDSRGQAWAGYAPSKRLWFVDAVRSETPRVVWTDPYLFFVTKDAGVTGSIAFSRGGHRYVLGVDFMLTDLSRVTAKDTGSRFASLITSRDGSLVALPRDPRFDTPEGVRGFFVDYDKRRRKALAQGREGDVAAQLPQVSDLGNPLLEAAVAAAPADAPGVYPFRFEGAQRWAGRVPVGGPERGLWLYVVEPE